MSLLGFLYRAMKKNCENFTLCLHQGAELYGSDRSFLEALKVLSRHKSGIDVILPQEGALAEEVRKLVGVNLSFYSKGILRKRSINRPIIFIWDLISSFFFYLLKFRRYKIIYINTVVMFSALLAAVFYRFSGKRIVCHVREIPSGYQLKVFRMILWLSNVELIFNSKATEDAFGLSGTVIYNGVERYPSVDRSHPVKDDNEDKRVNFLLIGRINDWKGQSLLIEAIAMLTPEDRSRVSVRIVGSPFDGYGHLLEKLSKMISDFELGCCVQLLGFSSNPGVHYEWADYIVVASIRPEPFGRVAIEAFAHGKPVIAARHGGLVEIVEQGINGFFFEPGSMSNLSHTIQKTLSLSALSYEELSQESILSFEKQFSIDRYHESLRILFFGKAYATRLVL